MLAQSFLQRYQGLNLIRVQDFSPAALELLTRYRWPDKVREMINVVQRLVVLASGPRNDQTGVKGALPLPAARADDNGPALLAEMERRHILKVLTAKGARKGDAALALDIDCKTTPAEFGQIPDRGLRAAPSAKRARRQPPPPPGHGCCPKP